LKIICGFVASLTSFQLFLELTKNKVGAINK